MFKYPDFCDVFCKPKYPELGTLEWLISGLTNACSPLVIDLQIGIKFYNYSKVFSSECFKLDINDAY